MIERIAMRLAGWKAGTTHGLRNGFPQCRQCVSDRAVIAPQAGHMVCEPYSSTSIAEFILVLRILYRRRIATSEIPITKTAKAMLMALTQ